MSEEEKKAIKILQEEHDVMINPKLEAKYTSDEVIEALYNVIMLVRRQQKEIEELKKPKYLVHFENNEITKMELINDYISKDKIREKIKNIKSLTFEENSITRDYILTILEELLEENDE